ncbi:50S ribosomal protein L13 [Candidatus Pacearchaeota archaeon]|nr:MAG: 50S ribosomal protein L13 [Candidatus Pacearchaeota archaeon]
MEKLEFDGRGAVFGRLASKVAKELLKGKSVEVYNCGEILMSGRLDDVKKELLAKIRMGKGGSLKGPKYPRNAEKLVKRMIRGMLPWDRTRGREAYRRLRCFVGEGKNMLRPKEFKYNSLRKAVSINQIIGGLK